MGSCSVCVQACVRVHVCVLKFAHVMCVGVYALCACACGNCLCRPKMISYSCVHLCNLGSKRDLLLSVGFLLYNAAASFPVTKFLEKHETKFYSVVNPRFSLMRLKRKGVISDDVESRIKAAANVQDAQDILYVHLMQHADVDILMKYFEVVSSAADNPAMEAFGRKVKEELQQGWLVG